MNAVEQGRCMREKWERYKSPVAVGLDASRFDQHVSPMALKWEHAIYLAIYRGDSFLRRLLSWQVHNRGRGYCQDGRLKYRVDGCRMSGDMNTALGNCLLMCAMVHAYASFVGLKKFSLANNGDDCIVIFERSELPKFQRFLESWFTDMGFTMKVEAPVYDFEQIEFCQTRPVLGPRGYTMTRIPQVAMAKDCISIIPVDTRAEYNSWMASVGEGGLALTSGMPIWQSFYRAMHRAAAGAKPRTDDQQTGFKMLAVGLEAKVLSVSQASRYSFWLAFGVTPDMQVEIEKYYDTIDLTYHKEIPGIGVTYLPPWL